ncbi:hypothetical protein HANVADRAFT_4922 [Hanseniaspora valbyensis NRRL Y-1626]|uniref:Uncharacterized protein n=1 Tax=Hanseniaspora valbyensis NRRL Y-1626 TaxID=766949 RepID=A0A1B7TKA6_9ASCO|nr:hypothetical protein HANVADRAFT_4922 [Hanseniaspora valbyensis NRRL Y-1626]
MIQTTTLRLLPSKLEALSKRDSSCTGSSQESIILGVLIPVAVIVILFSGIFIHLKQKAKREQAELEADPHFDGNLEFYEYDTPQIANTFNQVNNDSLIGKDNSLDYEKEGDYQNKLQQSPFNQPQGKQTFENNNNKTTNYNPFE